VDENSYLWFFFCFPVVFFINSINNFVDVAGVITVVSTGRNYIVNGCLRQMYVFELSDKR